MHICVDVKLCRRNVYMCIYVYICAHVLRYVSLWCLGKGSMWASVDVPTNDGSVCFHIVINAILCYQIKLIFAYIHVCTFLKCFVYIGT